MTLLHNRSKWQRVERNIEPGNIVIIVDETRSRNVWRTGRVVSVINNGSHARKFDVLRDDGERVEKDRMKLVLLELEE